VYDIINTGAHNNGKYVGKYANVKKYDPKRAGIGKGVGQFRDAQQRRAE
jgi:hypothetical protein